LILLRSSYQCTLVDQTFCGSSPVRIKKVVGVVRFREEVHR
jgi:hypothetical protein